MNYTAMTPQQLKDEHAVVRAQFEQLKARGLKLNMARGKPGKEQRPFVQLHIQRAPGNEFKERIGRTDHLTEQIAQRQTAHESRQRQNQALNQVNCKDLRLASATALHHGDFALLHVHHLA